MDGRAQHLIDENMESAELNIYTKDGSCFSMALTDWQAGLALSVLGFRILDENTYKVLSDDAIATKVMPRLSRLSDDWDDGNQQHAE